MIGSTRTGGTPSVPSEAVPAAPVPADREMPFVDLPSTPSEEGTPQPLSTPRQAVLVPADRPARILIVEDEPLDRECIEAAFRQLSTPVELRSVNDGSTAIDFLLRRGDYESRHAGWTPDIVLLDLQLPSVSGFEVLREVRLNPALDALIVCVLTNSEDRDTVRRLYRLGANSYLIKPSTMKGFRDLASRLQGFWFDIAKLPQ